VRERQRGKAKEATESGRYELYVIRFQQYRGLEQPATTLPTCCPRYPPGSTLLECRLEGDQPVAHVVQVPGDENSATQKSCLLVETKQTHLGPLSRIVSRPPEGPTNSQSPMSYCLESRECPEGPFALAATVPLNNANCSNIVTALETTKGSRCPNGPISKITYGPTVGKTPETTKCHKNSHDPSITFIDCTTSKTQASAKMTKCLKNDAKVRAKSCFETRVSRDGNCPTAVGFLCPPDHSSSCQHNVLEVKVDECGPRTRMIACPRDDSKSCGFMESKCSQDGPSAKMTQQLVDTCREEKLHQEKIEGFRESKAKSLPSPSEFDDTCREEEFPRGKVEGFRECVDTCPGSKKSTGKEPISVPERRNGLDPDDNIPPSPFHRLPRKVCPPHCCKAVDPARPRSCMDSFQRRRPETLSAGPSRSCKCALPPSRASKRQKSGTEDCTKQKEGTRARVCNGERTKTKDIASLIKSEELLTKYRDYVPPNLLLSYEACRRKRNGLQDQCKLPIPSAVLQLKRREMSGERDGNESGNQREDWCVC
ncbi:hypothetical protein WH47_07845, partial [Habropoda laboriosa]